MAVLLVAALFVVAERPAIAAPNSLALRATYDVAAYIRWGRGTMTVSSTANVTNTTDQPVRLLAFNLVPLVTGDAAVIGVRVRGKRVDPIVRGQTIVVPLAKPLAPEARTKVRIRYRARFNAITGPREELFAQSEGIITAYRWIPWLSRRQPFTAPNFGETWVTAVSPRVTVTLTSRRPLIYATTGRRTSSTRLSQTFRATAVRDFNFSASPDYRVKKMRWHGITVRVLYRSQSGRALADGTIAALRRYNGKVGVYPYRRLTVAEVPLGTGMESPALIWVSAGVAPQRMAKLIAHEVAHQWSYGLVGNNQATQPFVDEAVADFLMRDMFDAFRRARCPKAALDKSVYDYSRKCYPEVVYVQGSRYLDRYRQAVGNKAFWTGLRNFYETYGFKLAGTRALLDALDSVSGYDSSRHKKRFPHLFP